MCDEARIANVEKMLRKLLASMTGTSAMSVPGTGDPCGGAPACPAPQVSPQTQAANRALTRAVEVSPIIAGLGVGAVTTAISTAAPGEQITLMVVDLVSTLTNLDAIRVIGTVAGVERVRFNGGVFARGNANGCTTACGQSVCLWPTESIVWTVTNQSAAVLGAADTLRLDLRRAFVGEAGFDCGECV